MQTNIAHASGQALASSDTSGMSLYTSPYWLYKCFIIPILRIYFIYQMEIHFRKAKTVLGHAIHYSMSPLRETVIVTRGQNKHIMGHNAKPRHNN